MSGELKFDFEELPLIVDLGFEAGLVNGIATIGYEDDGEWFVREIALDGFRKLAGANIQAGGIPKSIYERKPVVLDRASYTWLYSAICDQLENGRFKNHVVDAVQNALSEHDEDSGTRRPDPNAEHSTMNRAQQGA
jgi:hypothetical protein